MGLYSEMLHRVIVMPSKEKHFRFLLATMSVRSGHQLFSFGYGHRSEQVGKTDL